MSDDYSLGKYYTFPTTVGIEYTYIFKEHCPFVTKDFHGDDKRLTEKQEDILSAYEDKISNHVREVRVLRPYLSIHEEAGIVEIASPIHVNLRDAIKFYTDINSLMTERNFGASFVYTKGNEEIHYCGGGGHIHIGHPVGYSQEFLKLYRRNFFIDALNRPYLNWLFREWNQNSSSAKCAKNRLRDYDKEYTKENLLSCATDRFFPVCMRDGDEGQGFGDWGMPTLELRFFRSPENTQMLIDFVDFALAYQAYIIEITKRGREININSRYTIKRSHDYVIRDFISFTDTLGLDCKRYVKYFDNYVFRATYGEL